MNDYIVTNSSNLSHGQGTSGEGEPEDSYVKLPVIWLERARPANRKER